MYYGILFSGQGAQRSGMGVELMADSLFSRIVSWASDVCELDLLKIMKNEHNELNKTVYVQPAIVTVSYGIYQMLKRDLPQLPIKGMVGLSLGEYAALIASNSLSFEEGIKLVADRARFMQQDADREISTLAAVLDPQLQEIKELITAQQENGQRVYIANYNSPRQIVVGGALTDLKATLKKMEEDKLAKRTILLKVNGAFHTPFFNGARQQMHNRLQTVDFHEPQIEVISNTTNSLFHCEDLQGILEKQLAIPTHFGANVKELVKHAKIDTTLEIGPGKTLSRFAHQVDQQLNTQHRSKKMELTDKVVFISGSTRGIGAATALEFAKAGSRLILNGRQDDLPKAFKEKLDLLGTEYHYLKGDIANEESVSELAAAAWQIYEKIDILINNAGITNDKLMMGMKTSDFDQVINVNLRGTFMLTQPIFKKMLKKRAGCIINLASIVGLHGNTGQANYAASKAGIIGLTKSIAQEGARRGIRCNAIAPGMITSDMTEKLSERVKEQILSRIPLNRLGQPEEVAKTAKFLAENDYLTGQTIVVDGGMTI